MTTLVYNSDVPMCSTAKLITGRVYLYFQKHSRYVIYIFILPNSSLSDVENKTNGKY